MSNVHNFQTSIICQVLHATLRVSEGSTIPTIELIAICDAFWKIVTFLALAIHIVSHSFMLGGIHPWQRHEECIIRAPSLEKIFLWCYHCSADEWLELCTATKLISPDPMLLIWRSDLNLNIFMCVYLQSRVDTEKRLDNRKSLAIVDIIRQEAGGESSALLFRALYAVPFPTHSLSNFETGRCVVLLSRKCLFWDEG